MKLHWKVAIVMLVGLLVVGQIATLHYAIGASERMAAAEQELGAAKKALKAQEDAQAALLVLWNKMSKQPMTPTEKAIMNFLKEEVAERINARQVESHAITAVENMWREMVTK